MLETPGTLPSDPDELRAVAEQLRDLARSQALKIEKLEHQLAGHRKARFGSKSESADQLRLDLQEETEIAAAAAAQQGEEVPAECLLYDPVVEHREANWSVPQPRRGDAWPPRPPRSLGTDR